MADDRRDLMLASDSERERALETLRVGAAEGRLTVDELEQRTAHALAARTRAQLAVLTRDLPGLPPRPAVQPARARIRRHPARGDELVAYVAVNLLLIVVWAATGADYFWPIWPLLGWGIGIATGHGTRGGRRRGACSIGPPTRTGPSL